MRKHELLLIIFLFTGTLSYSQYDSLTYPKPRFSFEFHVQYGHSISRFNQLSNTAEFALCGFNLIYNKFVVGYNTMQISQKIEENNSGIHGWVIGSSLYSKGHYIHLGFKLIEDKKKFTLIPNIRSGFHYHELFRDSYVYSTTRYYFNASLGLTIAYSLVKYPTNPSIGNFKLDFGYSPLYLKQPFKIKGGNLFAAFGVALGLKMGKPTRHLSRVFS